MKIINRMIFFLLGKKAYSKKSKGRIWRGKYFVSKGRIDKGEIIFFC